MVSEMGGYVGWRAENNRENIISSSVRIVSWQLSGFELIYFNGTPSLMTGRFV
jgi:hypothetical protein